MWVYVGDDAHPTTSPLHARSRPGRTEILPQGLPAVLLAGRLTGITAWWRETRSSGPAAGRTPDEIIEAEKAAPEIAQQAIEMVRALYAVEKQAAALSVAERLDLRQSQSAPVLAQLRQKLLSWKEQLLPKHPMAEAVNYALGQWTELNTFCFDGAVPIDNNISEREMKRVVLNRKNSLFRRQPTWRANRCHSGKPTSTCRRLDVDPQLYLTQL